MASGHGPKIKGERAPGGGGGGGSGGLMLAVQTDCIHTRTPQQASDLQTRTGVWSG